MSEYTCNQDLQNLGNLKCMSLEGTPRKLILCLRTLASGANNEFATESAFTKAALQAKFDNASSIDRYYTTKEIANVEITEADNTGFTDDYGQMFMLRIGTRSFVGKIIGATSKYIQKLASFNNNENLAAFIVFDNGSVGYLTDATTELKVLPRPIKGFVAKSIMEDKIQKCHISFAYDLEGPEVNLLRVLDAKDLDFEALSANDVYALDDVTLAVTNPLATGFTLTANIMGRDELPLRGLEVADLTLTDDSAGAETITSITETSTPGVYTVVATIAADGYILTGSKSKYSFNTTTFTVAP